MRAEIIFTTTNVLESTEPDDEVEEESEKPMDRSMMDPWLVVILLAVMLIIGAVLRDLVKVKLDKNKKKKVDDEEEGEEE